MDTTGTKTTESTQADNLQDLIGRLRVEKASWEHDDFDAGKMRGRQYALGARYTEFLDYASAPIARCHAGPFDSSDSLPSSEEKHLSELCAKNPTMRKGMYRGGWIKGMWEVWAQMKGQVQAAD